MTAKEFLTEMFDTGKLPPRFDQNDEFLAGLLEKYAESKKTQETIICSAIYINDEKSHQDQPTNIETGYVISGRRHNNCYATIISLHGSLDLFLDIHKHTDADQGFITSLNRYVDREEAFTIASNANQLLYPKLYDSNRPNILTSECLFPTDWTNFKY